MKRPLVSTVLSRAPAGLSAPLVRVEVHLGPGLPAFHLVGLPEAVVRESRERVRSALMTTGFDFPPGRITVNLSPADLPKEGHSGGALSGYRGRISGPLIDRIDMHVELAALPADHLMATVRQADAAPKGDNSVTVARRVAAAQGLQMQRQGKLNAWLTTAEVTRICKLERDSRAVLSAAISKLGLSARGFHRVLKVARTCADLAGSPDIRRCDLSEAVTLRALDRLTC